jgi:hypothetical protein
MQKNSTFTNMPFLQMLFMHKVISSSKWLWSKLPCPTNHNANMHNLDCTSFLHLNFKYFNLDLKDINT